MLGLLLHFLSDKTELGVGGEERGCGPRPAGREEGGSDGERSCGAGGPTPAGRTVGCGGGRKDGSGSVAGDMGDKQRQDTVDAAPQNTHPLSPAPQFGVHRAERP